MSYIDYLQTVIDLLGDIKSALWILILLGIPTTLYVIFEMSIISLVDHIRSTITEKRRKDEEEKKMGEYIEQQFKK